LVKGAIPGSKSGFVKVKLSAKKDKVNAGILAKTDSATSVALDLFVLMSNTFNFITLLQMLFATYSFSSLLNYLIFVDRFWIKELLYRV
jgi:hypothetical protein